MPTKQKRTSAHGTVTVDIPQAGRDEMNLAEFPLSVLTDRAPEGTKTLIFHNQHGSLTISSSDVYGLPRAQDADVMVALIQLTKQKNDFKESTVNFTRYELIRLLGWPNEGKSYKRLGESMKRWHGVTLIYDGCWWDNRAKRYGDANIHILESVVVLEGITGATKDSMQPSLPLSSFEWNKKFIESCQADNLKYLDLSLYFSLKHPSSKRLYRFLDKRFYLRPEWIFSLAEIAFERVGLSRSYARDAGKIKEKLKPAIEELESKDFLAPMSSEERYFKDGKDWKIRLCLKAPALAAPLPTLPLAEPEPLIAALVQRGVTKATAADLAQCYPVDAIEAKLEVFDWLTEKQDKRVAKSPAGYLVTSLEKDFATPKGFVTKAEHQRQQELLKTKALEAAKARRHQQEQDDREKAERKALDAYWDSQTKEKQDEIDQSSLSLADPEILKLESGPLKRMGQQIRRHAYIRQLLAEREKLAAEE